MRCKLTQLERLDAERIYISRERAAEAKKRLFSFRSANGRWDPKGQRAAPWNSCNTRKRMQEGHF